MERVKRVKKLIMTAEESLELVSLFQQGKDSIQREKAMEQLLKKSHRFVVKIASSVKIKSGSPTSKKDLIVAGQSGLFEAVVKYDLDNFQFHFLTFARWWIDVYMWNLINGDRTISIPQNFFQSKDLKEIERRLEDSDPTLDLKTKKVRNVMDALRAKRLISISYCGDPESEDYYDLNEIILDEDQVDTPEKKIVAFLPKAIEQVFKGSKKCLRNCEIFCYYFGISGDTCNHTLEETGEKFGLTREMVRQIIEKGRKKIIKSILLKREEIGIFEKIFK